MNNLVSVVISLCGFLQLNSAALTVIQGRRMNQNSSEVEQQTVVGLATIKLSGDAASQPTYFFDCVTDRNNGSGLRWTRSSFPHSFRVGAIPGNRSGIRMYVGGIHYPDLDIYVCSDHYSDDIVRLNITDVNPAIMAVKEYVEVIKGLSTELSVYVSGYPSPAESQITWQGPQSGDEIIESDGVIFKDGRKTLLLLDVHPDRSGLYTCKIIASHNRSATADICLHVYDKPTISSVFPLSSVITQEANSVYTFPPAYKGKALACRVFGSWPLPKVEWYKGGLPLSDESGIISTLDQEEVDDFFGVYITVELTWRREFSRVDAGNYQCVVCEENSSVILASQDVRIKPVSTTQPDEEVLTPCHVEERSVYFQIRILGTDCLNWNMSQKQQIAAEFHNKVLSAVRAECQCNVNDDKLRVIGVPECSVQVERAAVFHGVIETETNAKTEQIFCALYSWQVRSPLLLINGVFQAVDTSCAMEATLSASEEECFQTTAIPGNNNIKDILTIIGGMFGFVMVIILLITIVCCVGCYCCHREKSKIVRDHTDSKEVQPTTTAQCQGDEEHTYDHIELSTTYGSNGPTRLDGPSDDLGYNTLTISAADTMIGLSQSHNIQWQKNRPLPPPGNSLPNSLGVGEFKGIGDRFSKLPNLSQAPDTTPNNANLYEHISITDLQLDIEEVQPYSVPVKSLTTCT